MGPCSQDWGPMNALRLTQRFADCRGNRNPWEGCKKQTTGRQSPWVSDSVGLEWGPIIGVSEKVPRWCPRSWSRDHTCKAESARTHALNTMVVPKETHLYNWVAEKSCSFFSENTIFTWKNADTQWLFRLGYLGGIFSKIKRAGHSKENPWQYLLPMTKSEVSCEN